MIRGKRLLVRLAVLLGLAAIPFVIVVIAYIAYAVVGTAAGGADATGTLRGLGVSARVTIARDERGIPHVRAANERDLFFADGYLQGSDRLFQLDLARRLVTGRLAEIFGRFALESDMVSRTYDIDAIARAQLAALTPRTRANLDAFAAGVNAAIATRPLPPEFRLLAYRPAPWRPVDSLVASFATVLALTDDWNAIAARARIVASLGPRGRDAFYPISDPAYDTPVVPSVRASIAPLPPLSIPFPLASPLFARAVDVRGGLGSNDVVAGAALTTTHRALLGNDPHLQLRMPGVWYLIDLEAPGFHVAGATLPGVPGVVLGHDERVAWGATNGTVETVRVFRERFVDATHYRANGRVLAATVRRETFGVRFSADVTHEYLRTRHGFVFDDTGPVKRAADWTADVDRRSTLDTFDALSRATTAAGAAASLASYVGPPQNFVIADDRGDAAYTLAGEIPIDDAWGLAERDGERDAGVPARVVASRQLPHVAAGRDVFAITANDRTYGRGYPYRLSAAFSPPYRAARIAQVLGSRPYAPARIEIAQADVTSIAERDLAHTAAAALARARIANDPDLDRARAAFARFDGRFATDSTDATFVYALRLAAVERLARTHLPPALAANYVREDFGAAFVALARALRERPHGWVARDDYDAFLVDAARESVVTLRAHGGLGAPWSTVGARVALHPLAGFGLRMWNGVRFPGLGDAYAPHVQTPGNAQSFRAIWDVGRWNAGGIVIPQGESGEPGSAHYRDLAATWLAGTLVPLPFGTDAVARATRSTLELVP